MNILATITFDSYNEIAEVTHPTMKAYADRIGAKFVVLSSIQELSKHKYDRIILIHTDTIIRPDTPSLFNVVPESWVGAFHIGQHIPLQDLTSFAEQRILPKPKTWGDRWYSYGVIVANRSQMSYISVASEEHFNYCLNQYIPHEHILDIGPRFNRMPYFDQFSNGYPHLDFYIIHYSQLMQQLGVDNLKQLIQQDLTSWSILKEKKYHIPRSVLVRIGGGLGDQICAEPVIRELRRLHPNDYIIVESSWPELWENLKGYKVDQIITSIEEAKFFEDTLTYYTYRNPDSSIQQLGMTHGNMSSTELTSYLALTRPIPPEKREIKIGFAEAERHSMLEKLGCNLDWLSTAVILHPGLTWPTRTLAVSVWKDLIKLLVKEEKHVVVIGQGGPYRGPRTGEHIGVLEFEVPDIVIDARNKLSVKETLSLLASSEVLISNDSSPIHLAGATDILILGMFTTKHSCFVLPYRLGTPWHKAIPINKTPDCWPCGVNALRAFPEGLRMDLCKNYDNPYCCHPTAKEIMAVYTTCLAVNENMKY